MARKARKNVLATRRALRRGGDIKLRAREPGIYFVGTQQMAEALGNPGLAYRIAAEIAAGRVRLSRFGEDVGGQRIQVRALEFRGLAKLDDVARDRVLAGQRFQSECDLD